MRFELPIQCDGCSELEFVTLGVMASGDVFAFTLPEGWRWSRNARVVDGGDSWVQRTPMCRDCAEHFCDPRPSTSRVDNES